VSALNTFVSSKFGEIRTIVIDGEPWFVGSDVARALAYTNPQKAIRDHCKGVNESFTVGNRTPSKVIPESDLYRLILRSKLPAAEVFQDWVTMEVLPSIRRTGRYEAAAAVSPEPREADGVWLSREQFNLLLDRALRLGIGQPAKLASEDVEEWLGERGEAHAAGTEAAVLYADYRRWAQENERPTYSPVAFGKLLSRCGVIARRSSRSRFWAVRVKGGAA
jgi:prophage antirepressor-like protein